MIIIILSLYIRVRGIELSLYVLLLQQQNTFPNNFEESDRDSNSWPHKNLGMVS